ncbi:t-SNARE [Lipomyces arxii]|uniref:t-SNARE n=1 Tax=Lipomyces arxii TaxID=56418 RepID=UPI0034CEC393
MAIAMQDRTSEYRSCVEAVIRMSNTTASMSRNQIVNSGLGTNESDRGGRTEFTRRALTISKDINAVTGRLQRLTQLAKRKTLFDDRPVEISELTFVIRQDLAKINHSISELQTYVKHGKKHWGRKGESQLDEHSENVVVLLQGKLTDVTSGFKDVLEVRTKNIQASRSRTEQFISSASSASTGLTTPASPLYGTKSSGVNGTSSLENPYGGSGSTDNDNGENREFLTLPDQQQSLVQMEEMRDPYLSERDTAIEAIESTIHELGGIFSQLATMVAEQNEVVQRIDADTEDISMNISGAQRELLKYFATVSSNRWLMVRVFGIVVVFFLLWVLVS